MGVCLLLLLSGMLFAVQFCINKYFQTYKPRGETSTVLYAVYGKAVSAVLFLIIIPFTVKIYWGNSYTVLVGVVHAVLNLIITLVGIRVLSVGSVAFYTIAMMIGGMAVPVVFGVFLFSDGFGWMRGLAFVLIAAAVVLTAGGERKKPTLKAVIMYVILFLCNGFIGVFTALHTNIWGKGIPDVTFMFGASVVAVACYMPAMLIIWLCEKRRKTCEPVTPENTPVKTYSDLGTAGKIFYRLSSVFAGIAGSLGNYLIVMGTAAEGIGSVVTFPLVTGGTILFTTLLSLIFYREKPKIKQWIGIVLIPVALVIFIL